MLGNITSNQVILPTWALVMLARNALPQIVDLR